MKQKYNFSMPGGKTSVRDELNKLDSVEDFNFKIIPYVEIEPNKINDYPITDIEQLAYDIRASNYLEPLGVICNPEGSPKKYRLFSGERRYTAIGMILQEDPDYPLFKKGIPCMVKRNLNEIDEEIMLILANKQRNMTEDFKQQKARRLIRLYEMKQEQTGEKINVTKKVSEELGIGIRQAQRYSKIERSLIPELQAALDESKISLENAANIAGMDEASQRLTLQLLETNKSISAKEISRIRDENRAMAEKLSALEADILERSKETESLRQEVHDKERQLSAAAEQETRLRSKLEQELKNSQPGHPLEEALQKDLADMQAEKRRLEQELLKQKSDFKSQEEQISHLQEELAKQKSDSPPIPPARLEELAACASLENAYADLERKARACVLQTISFRKKYEGTPAAEKLKQALRDLLKTIA